MIKANCRARFTAADSTLLCERSRGSQRITFRWSHC